MKKSVAYIRSHLEHGSIGILFCGLNCYTHLWQRQVAYSKNNTEIISELIFSVLPPNGILTWSGLQHQVYLPGLFYLACSNLLGIFTWFFLAHPPYSHPPYSPGLFYLACSTPPSPAIFTWSVLFGLFYPTRHVNLTLYLQNLFRSLENILMMKVFYNKNQIQKKISQNLFIPKI